MARTLIEELIIPEEQGKAFTVEKGQTLRLIEVEGPQMADVAISACPAQPLCNDYNKPLKVEIWR